MRRKTQLKDRIWKVLGIVALGMALALALLNGWYYG